MPKVQLLPPSIAERIAAGEVVERPSSVVKELVENSIDAGATEIAVILEDGGRSLIEVLDNGKGMSRADLELSVKRHATSKLRELADLEKIMTLGFRGEALPSIAAAADVTITTRSEETPRGPAYEWTGSQGRTSEVTFGHFLGSSHGTRVRAQSLFSQIPARLKFLKSPRAEMSQVREWLERLSLSHPEIGFRLENKDKTILNLKRVKLPKNDPSQAEVHRVRTVLGDRSDYPVVTLENNVGEFRLRAHWIQGLSLPQTRKLVQIVNGRVLRDKVLQQAMLGPFRQSLLPGQFPAIALFLEIDPSQIDVNVHPTKTEVRFLESQKIFHAVQSLVESMISQHGVVGFAKSASASRPSFQTSGFQTPGHSGQRHWRASSESSPKLTFQGTASGPSLGSFTLPESSSSSSFLNDSPETSVESQSPQAQDRNSLHRQISNGRFAGSLFKTYLMFELEDREVGMLDQHAAHERIRYEQLKHQVLQKGETPQRQELLLPEAVSLSDEDRFVLEKRLHWFENLGFEVEFFGDHSLLFRGVPAAWGTEGLRVRLKNLVERAIHYNEPSEDFQMDENLFESLASEACHSAIRAGDELNSTKAHALVKTLFECQHPWNCPHGRPTVVRVPRHRLEEWFERKI